MTPDPYRRWLLAQMILWFTLAAAVGIWWWIAVAR